MTQQFWKGLATALISVIVAAFAVQPINWVLLAVTAVSTILTYSGKNIFVFFHSDSPAGALSWINLASGLLVAIGTGILEGFATYFMEGAIMWNLVWKVVAAAAFTYLGTTFFAPQHNKAAVRGFISPATSRAIKRGTMTVMFLGIMAVGVNAQGLFSGFTKPVTVETIKTLSKDQVAPVLKVRFDVSLIGMSTYFKLNEEGKIAGLDTPVPLSKVGAGLALTQFNTDASRRWAAGLAFTLPTAALGDRYGVAVMGSYSVFKVGINYDIGLKPKEGLSLLTGLSFDLFNLVQ